MVADRSMPRILLIHQAFVLPDEPGGTRHYELVRYLAQRGYSCTVIASNLSYITGKSASLRGTPVMEQRVKGLRILRAYTYPSLHRSFFWRTVSFLSFMASSLFTAIFKVGPTDLVIGTSPPVFQAVSAWLAAVFHRSPFLLEVRDLWPEFAIDIGILRNRLLIWLSRWLERFLYARATHIIVNSPAYCHYLQEKGLPESKISLIPNGVDPDMFDPGKDGGNIRTAFNLTGKFIVTYTGALGLANDVYTILRAAAHLQNYADIHFLLVGDGKEHYNLQAYARELHLVNVTFAGAYPKAQIPDILAASDVCVATLKDIPMFRSTYPNKVFDYMAAGRPIVLGIDGVIREVIEDAKCGIFVQPGDDVALAEAVRSLYHDRVRAKAMGNLARAYAVQHFNRRQHAIQFEELVRRLSLR